MAGSRVLANEHSRRYWSTRNPVRVIDERFYYADLLDRVLGDGRYASFIELGGFPGTYLTLKPAVAARLRAGTKAGSASPS